MPQTKTTTNRFAEVLQPYVDREVLAGAVTLVANRDRVLDVTATGFADRAARQPMTPETMFWIASMTKPFTGALLMTLVDEGTVVLDAPVTTYLPEFKDLWQIVSQEGDRLHLQRPPTLPTVRQLLDMTSGMPFCSVLEVPTMDQGRLREVVRSYVLTPLLTPPGTKYAYSNASINTAGRIIEVVTGKPYATVLSERFLNMMDLEDTTFWPSEEQTRRLAKTYKPGPDNHGLVEMPIGQLHYPLHDHERQGFPAGGLFSTAGDCARFCQMVLNHGVYAAQRYLSAAAVAAMTKRQTPPSLPESYGLGWATGDHFASHGGAYATNMHIDFAHNLIFIYMVQHCGFPGNGGEAFTTFRQAADAAYQ